MSYRSMLSREKRFLVAILFVVGLLAVTITPVFADEGEPPVEMSLDDPHTVVSSDGTAFTAEGLASALATDALGSVEEASFSGNSPDKAPMLIAEDGSEISLVDEEVLQLEYPSSGESIIGGDGRTRVATTTTYPWRAVAHLVVSWKNGSSGGCTGWFIGPRTVVTAGHCVYSSSKGGWASSIKVYPGRNGSTTPYGYGTSHRLFSVTGWTSSANIQYDYGAIQLKTTLGNTVGWFGYRWQSSSTFSGAYRVTGYPGDKTYGTMWTMQDNPGIRQVQTRRLFYAIDTYPGQSGAPVYHNYSTTCNPCSVAIHTYGVDSSGYNSGTRITQSVFNNLKSWKAWVYP